MIDTQKIAIVTGAGSGIGRAVTIALNNVGWSLVLAGRRESSLKETADHCGTDRILVVTTDITDQESVQNLFQETKKKYGRLDLLFNNAGINIASTSFEEIPLKDWNLILNTNLTGSFLCTQEAFKLMKNQNPTGGRIINNGSISAHVPRPNSAPYTSSKHGITGLTKSTSLDGRKFNIACGQIDIGNAASALTQTIEKGIVQADGSKKIEPTISIEDVARSVVYMASLPLDTNIPFLTVMANQMPYMGRG